MTILGKEGYYDGFVMAMRGSGDEKHKIMEDIILVGNSFNGTRATNLSVISFLILFYSNMHPFSILHKIAN